MSPSFRFEYEVSPRIIADAADTSLMAMRAGQPPRTMRKAGLAWGVLFAQVLGLSIWAIVVGMDDWLIALAMTVTVIFGLLCALYLFVVVMHPFTRAKYERAISSAYRKLDSPRIRWHLNDTGFTVESRTTRREQPWTSVREAFVGLKFWILTVDVPERLLLPVSALPDGGERFMLDRITQAGGAVRMEESADCVD